MTYDKEGGGSPFQISDLWGTREGGMGVWTIKFYADIICEQPIRVKEFWESIITKKHETKAGAYDIIILPLYVIH